MLTNVDYYSNYTDDCFTLMFAARRAALLLSSLYALSLPRIFVIIIERTTLITYAVAVSMSIQQ